MAVCGNCKTESPRVRSRWNKDGVQQADECPNCAPNSFEKFPNPSDRKIWMGYEAHPNEYEKREDGEGSFYIRKPEHRAEQEARLARPSADEQDAQQRAEDKKRKERRTDPIRDPLELAAAVHKASEYAAWLLETAARAQEEVREAEELSWTLPHTGHA